MSWAFEEELHLHPSRSARVASLESQQVKRPLQMVEGGRGVTAWEQCQVRSNTAEE